jgi:ubiquinone/menaquinone biosynthesis C-methylase UbiE
MLASSVEFLACPVCGQGLSIEYGEGRRLDDAVLRCVERHRHVVKKGIARFNTIEPYSVEMRHAARMQLDSHTGSRYWYETFKAATGLAPEALAGKTVLDLGCGSGRYLEWVSKVAAHVVALDPTGVIDVCHDNLGDLPNVTYVQGGFTRACLKPRQFDFVYALGALHRAESTQSAFETAVRTVKPEGEISIWIDPKAGWIPPALTAWRKLTTRLTPWMVEVMLDTYIPAALRIREVPRIGGWAGRLFPLAGARDPFPLRGETADFLRAGVFESFTTPYSWRHTKSELLAWCRHAGLDVVTEGSVPISVRARKRPFLVESDAAHRKSGAPQGAGIRAAS